tara:strand:- start:305 stop:502 length:198 start_codon:yes stop_codon:yes gene_type:complete
MAELYELIQHRETVSLLLDARVGAMRMRGFAFPTSDPKQRDKMEAQLKNLASYLDDQIRQKGDDS